ncbi:MAG TPA: hypothetical protein VHR97_10020 [Candidatus Baltobacteraceae bacterium]|nr:hypothetical protein [Candidatus Baltobacteraceae bacterium]
MTIAVSVQGHFNGTVVEHNDCGGASGVARISRRSNFKWRVTPGMTTGSCSARCTFFHNGNEEGWAELTMIRDKRAFIAINVVGGIGAVRVDFVERRAPY